MLDLGRVFFYFSWFLWLCTVEIEIPGVCGVYLQVCECCTGEGRKEKGREVEGEGMHGESSLFLHCMAKRLWWLPKPEDPQNPPWGNVLEVTIYWLELVCEVKPMHTTWGQNELWHLNLWIQKYVVHVLDFSVWQENNLNGGGNVLNYSPLWVALG